MNQLIADRVLSYLLSERKDMEHFLSTLVLIESPSRNADTQQAILNLIEQRFSDLGYVSMRMPGVKTGGHLFARPRNRQKHSGLQMLVGHCDTVWDVGTIQTMPLIHENEKLKGPGVYDMKAGLTQILFALQAIQQLNLKPTLTPVVVINSDEEIGSHESTSTIRRLARIADRVFVLEPPLGLDGKLKTARKGLGRFTLTVKGKAAHAGLDPNQGANAIVELSMQVQKLFAMNDPDREVTVNVGMIEGGISPNVVAPESKAVIDVRVPNQAEAERITQAIMNLKPIMPGTELLIDGGIGRPPMERTMRNQELWKMAKSTAKLIQLELEEATAGGGSDGNTTSQFAATLDGLGTTGDGAHAKHEFIFLEKLIERTALLTLLLLQP